VLPELSVRVGIVSDPYNWKVAPFATLAAPVTVKLLPAVLYVPFVTVKASFAVRAPAGVKVVPVLSTARSS
jgi:hypothetical protein